METSSSPPPPLKIIARVPDTVGVLSFDPSSSSSTFTPDPALASEPATSPAAFSPCGKWLALPAPDGVRIYDVGGGSGDGESSSSPPPPKLFRFLAVEGGVSAALFSPGSTFLSTYTKPPSKSAAVNAAAGAAAATAGAKNLSLWRVADGAKVLSFACKSAQPPRAEGAWPLAVVGEHDKRAYHMVTNAVNVYDLGGASSAGGKEGDDAPPSLPVFRKLPLKGVAAFAAVAPPRSSGSPSSSSPSASHLLAAAVPEAKGAPGLVGIWEVDSLPLGSGMASAAAASNGNSGNGDGGNGGDKAATTSSDSQQQQQRIDPPQPVAKRSLMRASAVDLRWSPSGEALLALASTESDASNKSYYGDSKLHYLRSDGGNDCLVPLPKEGPVHDVAWSPRGDCFVVLAGFMPPRAVVFDSKCAPALDLGSGPFCHARWSPHHGRFLCLAGFGNLAGDLAFFDRKADGKLKPCGSARAAGGVSLEWSPDARLLLVSTTAPRLRVDNGVRVFKYDGSLVASKAWDVLLEARWRPAARGVYPDRPPSPRAAAVAGAGAGTAGGGASASSSSGAAASGTKPAIAAAPARPTAFVPPHLRGKGAPPPRAAKLSLGADDGERSVGAAPKKITGGDAFDMASVKACFSNSKARLPPGAEAILEASSGKSAAKNAKRRAAAAAKKKAAEEAGG